MSVESYPREMMTNMAKSSFLDHISACNDVFADSGIWRRDQACRRIEGRQGAIREQIC